MNVYVVLVIQVCIAGGTHIVAKAVLGTVDPAVLTFLRSLFSTAGLMTLFFVRDKHFQVEKRDWLKLTWLGLLGLPLNQFLYLYGLGFSTAANGALLYATTPVFVLVLSRFILKEKMTGAKILGVLLAFVGVAVIIFERGLDFSSGYTYGNLMITLAVLAWALFTIQGKPMVLKYGAVKTTALSMTIGMILFLPIGIYESTRFDFSSIDLSHWVGVAYLGLGTSVFGYMLWYYALGKIETSKAAVFANGQPILATILAVIFLQYTITAIFLVGATVTLTGVVLTQRG